MGVTINQNATHADIKGWVSGAPSHEVNITPEGGQTKNVPLQTGPDGDVNFVRQLQKSNPISKPVDLGGASSSGSLGGSTYGSYGEQPDGSFVDSPGSNINLGGDSSPGFASFGSAAK